MAGGGGPALERLYDAMACGVVVRDAAGQIVQANEMARRIFGGDALFLFADRLPDGHRRLRDDGSEMAAPELPHERALRMGRAVRQVTMGYARSGGVRWLLVDAVPVAQEGGSDVVLSFVDVTERRDTEEALVNQAFRDPLTRLANRALLIDRLQHAIVAAQRDPMPVGLLLMDLDSFKEVNDAFGHQAGDVLLRGVAERIRKLIRASDTVARLGGDEFAIVMPGAGDAVAARVARLILHQLQRPFDVEGQDLEVGASIGCALWPRHGEDALTLLRRADIAMYQAKRSSAGYAVYSFDDGETGHHKLALMAELRTALQGGQLVAAYQPIVSLATLEPTHAETLLRWHHPGQGLLMPDVFVPFAERSGLVRPLFEHVLDLAIQQQRAWREAEVDLGVTVNLSVRNLLDPELPNIVARLLDRHGASPDALGLEITESMLMVDPERALRVVAELRRLGVRLAIDDFGVGYSSLAYLQRLPVSAVKMDKSFVSTMTTDAGNEAIVRATIELAHRLGLQVIAEGVEDRPTWDALAGLGCDAVQGFYVARPMPGDTLLGWLARPPEAAEAGSRTQ